MSFIDSHCHIDGPEYDADRDEVIKRARDAGVTTMLNVGTGDPHGGAFERAVDLAETHADVYAAIGVHPHDAKLFDDAAETHLTNLVKQNSKVIGWGEIGLDYHYDHSPREVQREAFKRQLRIARERRLPISIHTREAETDTLAILDEEWKDSGLGGVIHCFTGTRTFAEAAVERGFLISFSGVITFKKAEELRETARRLPIEKLLIETDSPFLAPVPYRGRRNEPAYVVETARAIAELRGTTAQELGRETSENFSRLFKPS